MAESRLYLNVPYAEKDQAKALGARWDAGRKKWYVPEGKAAAAFAQWTPESLPGEAPSALVKSTAKSAPDEDLKPVAITQPADKNFIPYAGDEPPWD